MLAHCPLPAVFGPSATAAQACRAAAMVRRRCGEPPPPADDAPIPGLPPAAWPIVARFMHINDPGQLAVGMASSGTKALLDEIAAYLWAIEQEYRAQQEEQAAVDRNRNSTGSGSGGSSDSTGSSDKAHLNETAPNQGAVEEDCCAHQQEARTRAQHQRDAAVDRTSSEERSDC